MIARLPLLKTVRVRADGLARPARAAGRKYRGGPLSGARENVDIENPRETCPNRLPGRASAADGLRRGLKRLSDFAQLAASSPDGLSAPSSTPRSGSPLLSSFTIIQPESA